MSSVNCKIEDTTGYVLVAQGPQNVSFRFAIGMGEYLPDETTTPTATRNGLRVGFDNQHLALQSEENLYIKGDGDLVVVCQTPEITDTL